jgi:hypothetical protein
MKHSCSEKEKDINEEDNDIKEQMKQLIQENKALKQRMNKMEKSIKPCSSTVVKDSTININNDNRVTNNITIVAYGKEDMTGIDRDDIIRALKTGFNSTKHLTEVVHFNPKYPFYSNIKRNNFNMKNKLMYHNGSCWVTTSDPNMIDDLYNRKRDFIEENIEHYRDGLTKGDMTRLQRWLTVDDDDDRITRIKGELRELLFNKKEISETNERNIEVTQTVVEDIEEIVEIDNIDQENDIIFVKTERIPTIKGKNKAKKVASRNGRYRKAIARRRI